MGRLEFYKIPFETAAEADLGPMFQTKPCGDDAADD